VYKRYVGNTGQFYRVEDGDDRPSAEPGPLVTETHRQGAAVPVREWIQPPSPAALEAGAPPVRGRSAEERKKETPPPPPPAEGKAKFDLGAVFDAPAHLRGTLRDKLPDVIDLGDILLVLALIYLFLEGEEDEMLIVLGILIVMWILPLFGKDEEASN